MRLTSEMVWCGYIQGLFPMANARGQVQWYEPYERALFPISGIQVSRSLRKTIRQNRFVITYDKAFELVIRGCLRPMDNWINEEIIDVFTDIHKQGWAHSCECWLDGRLAGGVYGVAIGGCFSAESMFFRVRDASKVALWALVEKCRSLGFSIFDAQIMNPHLESLGAYSVSQDEYLNMLERVACNQTPWSRRAVPL